MAIKTEEIIFKSGSARQVSSKPKTVCEIFCYQPDNIEQMPLGNLYIVAELSLVKDCGHLNNLLASLIKREYYLYPERGVIKSFRSALKRANAHLADLAKQGNPEWLGKLHFICASIAKDELLFVQAGQPQAYLARENHLVNLGHRIIPDFQKPHPSKIFSSIITGKIEIGDKMIFATPAINEYLSASGLRQIMAVNNTPEDITAQIEKVMREKEKPSPLAVLVLKSEQETPLSQSTTQNERPRRITTPPIDLNEILKYTDVKRNNNPGKIH